MVVLEDVRGERWMRRWLLALEEVEADVVAVEEGSEKEDGVGGAGSSPVVG